MSIHYTQYSFATFLQSAFLLHKKAEKNKNAVSKYACPNHLVKIRLELFNLTSGQQFWTPPTRKLARSPAANMCSHNTMSYNNVIVNDYYHDIDKLLLYFFVCYCVFLCSIVCTNWRNLSIYLTTYYTLK